MTRDEIRDSVEEDLRGDCFCGYITKRDMREYLDDLEKWLKTAKNGDIYYYAGTPYELTITYEVFYYQNMDVYDNGTPIVVDLCCSDSDLEAIKAECEHYAIESSGFIEICETEDPETALFRFEKGKWAS